MGELKAGESNHEEANLRQGEDTGEDNKKKMW